MKINNKTNTTAYLSNKGRYTTFAFKDKRITFLTGKILERYTKVINWDNGYIGYTICCCFEKRNHRILCSLCAKI